VLKRCLREFWSGPFGWFSVMPRTTADRGVQRRQRAAGISREALRRWVNQAQFDVGARPGVTTAESQAALEAENKWLRGERVFAPGVQFLRAEPDPHHR